MNAMLGTEGSGTLVWLEDHPNERYSEPFSELFPGNNLTRR